MKKEEENQRKKIAECAICGCVESIIDAYDLALHEEGKTLPAPFGKARTIIEEYHFKLMNELEEED